MRTALACLLTLALAGPALAAEAPAPKTPKIDPADAPLVEAFRNHARSEIAKLTAEHFQAKEEPEMLCWIELKQMYMSLVAYELTGDIDHLRDLAKAIEAMRSTLKKGPHGFLGWRGLPIKSRRDPERPTLESDDIQTSFRAVWLFSRFLETVDREERLKKEFGRLREPLVDLMENHLVKKWEARGYWVELPGEGGIYRINSVTGDCRTLPWEKLSIAVDGLLALYRVTGNDEHMEKIVKIGALFKRKLELIDGHYQWYNWVPLGKWDVRESDPSRWKSWIGRSPQGGWYSVEIGIAAAIYHHAVVFDHTDMERFTKTQMEVSWNGDEQDPKYLPCNGKAPPERFKNQVFLCPALAPFNEKLARFVFQGHIRDRKLAKKDSPWHGGVLAANWLHDKYVMMPAAAGGKPMHAGHGQRFLAKKPNQELAETLAFEVVAPGFQIPALPSMMENMPEAPEPKSTASAPEGKE